jgi:hypothetical protein
VIRIDEGYSKVSSCCSRSLFAFRPLPAIALAQAKQAGLSGKQKLILPRRSPRLCGASLWFFKDVVQLPVGKLMNDRFHFHAHLDLLFPHIVCYSAEDFIFAVVKNSDTIG